MTLYCRQCNSEITNPRSKIFCSKECYKKYNTENYGKNRKKNGELSNITLPEVKIEATDFDELPLGKIKIKFLELKIENSKLKDEKKKLEDVLSSINELLNPHKKFYGALTPQDVKRFVHPDQQPPSPEKDINQPVVYDEPRRFVREDGSITETKTISREELNRHINPVLTDKLINQQV